MEIAKSNTELHYIARVERLFAKRFDNYAVTFISGWCKTEGGSLYKGYNGTN